MREIIPGVFDDRERIVIGRADHMQEYANVITERRAIGIFFEDHGGDLRERGVALVFEQEFFEARFGLAALADEIDQIGRRAS